MLVDVLQKISSPLTRESFGKILYALIQADCGRQPERIEAVPYNMLKPILNEHYTLTFIRSLRQQQYSAAEIASVLSHLYQYSYVAGLNSIASIQLQPHVLLNVDSVGRYIFNYETYSLEEYIPNVRHINDFKFISEPIQFIEKPCVFDLPRTNEHTEEMENLYSYDKCDQYLAFQLMLSSNSDDDNRPSTSRETTGRGFEGLSTARQSKVAELSKTSRAIFSKPYWAGYYYYGINQGSGFYVFDQ
ncbi:hypothetical protein [Drosophila suzukii associated hytrosavirus 1]|nr:hypothetical protein [Drosophila suzukii associated hytrosavirus 1]